MEQSVNNLNLQTPWHAVDNPEGLNRQLQKELNKNHKLFGSKVNAVARRQDNDDVLFYIEKGESEFALVHLTWRQSQHRDGQWPSTYFYKDREAVQAKIDKDIRAWDESESEPMDETGGFIAGKERVIIIGASSGIGKALAKIYALDGCLVAISGRREHLLEEFRSSFSGRMITACFDITTADNISELESLVKRLGGLDLLIISAGTGEPSNDLSWTIDKMTVDTNVNGFVSIANWAFNYFMNQGYGHLTAISSIAAYRGGSYAPAYNASKSFQSNYLEGLAIKARRWKKDVIITNIEPGFVDTKMLKADTVFWRVPVDKAARQIIQGLNKKRRKIFISKRWALIAWIMKWMPYWIYKRIG